MADVEEITQSLLAPCLDLLLPERSPTFVGRYSLSNRMVRSLAHLAATDGRHSHLLKCDARDALQVSVQDPASGHTAVVNSTGELFVKDATAASAFGGMSTILGDVYDPTNHALQVVVITP